MKIEIIEDTSLVNVMKWVNEFCEDKQVYDVKLHTYEYDNEVYHIATIIYEDYDDRVSEIESLKQHIAGLESEIKDLKKRNI